MDGSELLDSTIRPSIRAVAADWNRLSMRIFGSAVKLSSKILLKRRANVVLDTLRRLVQMVQRKLEILFEVGFPKTMRADQGACRARAGAGRERTDERARA